jgi:hypothetical protein
VTVSFELHSGSLYTADTPWCQKSLPQSKELCGVYQLMEFKWLCIYNKYTSHQSVHQGPIYEKNGVYWLVQEHFWRAWERYLKMCMP